MERIFISYARDDAQDIALRLRDDLSAAGHDIWLDTSEIAAGASWSRDIELAIERSSVVLALLTAGSYVSEICRAEQLRALRKGLRLIPVLIQLDADRPIHLENLNYVDLSDRYDELLPDLLTVIETGHIPDAPLSSQLHLPPQRRETSHRRAEKRDTRAFRRYITDLRDEPWLGDRYWWTHFLFSFVEVKQAVSILAADHVKPGRVAAGIMPRLPDSVALYFRPRTPDLYGAEGIRPTAERSGHDCPVPVYLVFDLESVITLLDSRFSEGDVSRTSKTYKTAAAFRDLPFEMIYHDSPFRPDERDEILTARRAQVFVPGNLSLEHLRHIWCRSTAEYEMLYHLLTPELRREWGERITVRQDYHLFNRHRVFVEQATLSAEGMLFEFNPGPGTFDVRAEINDEHVIDPGAFTADGALALDLSGLDVADSYTVRLYLDDALAYAGTFNPEAPA